jgi:hypothetical protein
MNLTKANKELSGLINEICTKLQELEFDVYTILRIPKISTGFSFEMHPKLSQFLQVEKKINDQKYKLKIKMLTTPKCFEQLTNGEWLNSITEELKNLKFPCKMPNLLCASKQASRLTCPSEVCGSKRKSRVFRKS